MVLPFHKVLFVGGNSDDFASLSRLLTQAGTSQPAVEWIARPNSQEVLSAVSGEKEICLIAHEPGIFDGLALVRGIRQHNADLPLVMFLKTPNTAVSKAALRAGVADCLSKDQLTPPYLASALRYASETASLKTRLKVSQERSQTLIESSPDLIFTIDLRGNFTSWNRAAERLTGYTRQAALQMNLAQILTPEDLGLVSESISRQLGGASDVAYQIEIITRHQHRIPVELRSRLLYRNGKPSGAQGLARDITEQRATEKALQESNLWLHGVVDLSPAAVYMLDGEGRVQMWNKAAENLFGWSEQEALGQLLPTIHPSQESEFNLLRQAVSRGQEPFQGELSRRRKDGRILRVSVSAAPLYEAEGKLHGVVCLATDITTRKLVKTHKDEALMLLAGCLAHDLNNLLTIIKGNAELGELKTRDATLRQAFGNINAAADSATLLVRQFRSISRKQVIRPEALNVNDIVQQIDEMMSGIAAANVKLRTHLADDLNCVLADAGQMVQVVLNLLLNAYEAMPAGGALTIETRNTLLEENLAGRNDNVPPGDYVLLCVSDTGRGMDEETRKCIFEPFFTTKTQIQEAGLGLASVYGIVKQINGHILVNSAVGRGTAVKIYLPGMPLAAAAKKPKANCGTETVLVVEGDQDLREVIGATLSAYGYQVLLSSDGETALRQLIRHDAPLDLVIADLDLPDLSTSEILSGCGASYPQVKFLYITSCTKPNLLVEGVLESASGFVQKPFTAELLTAKIREALDVSQLGVGV